MTLAIPYRNILWWAGYLAFALWLQTRLPGTDALIPGLIIACQEKDLRQLVWLGLAALLIQEGTGSLAFGGSVLWYSSLIIFFRIGEFLFETDSLFFVILLSIALGLVHAGILFTFGSLQNMSVPLSRLVEHALTQAAVIPLLWGTARLTRNWIVPHVDGL